MFLPGMGGDNKIDVTYDKLFFIFKQYLFPKKQNYKNVKVAIFILMTYFPLLSFESREIRNDLDLF